MPLLRKRPYDPDLGLPPGVSPEDGLWVVRFTGEVFADYGAYLRKQQLYARRGWSCKYTGRSGLTYEEALVSEERAKRAHGQFPECFEGPVLRLVHHSTLRPDELCHRVLTHFRNNFVPGEEVLGMRGEKPEPCRILNSLGADDGEDVAADLLNPVAGLDQKYEVEWLDGEGGSDVSIVSRGQLSRVKDKHPISRPMLKTWLERVVHCESTGVKGAPFLWRAKRELAEKCNLPEALPQDLEMKLQKAAQRTLATKKKAKKTKLEGDNKKQRAPAARPGPCKPTENGATCTRAPLGHSGSVHPPAEAGASGRAREGASNGLQTPKSVERPKKKRKTTPSEPKKVAERPQAAPSAEPSPSSSPIPGTPVQAEALEDTDRRLSAGSLKRAVFEILKGVGPYGASTTYLLQRLRDRNMNREVTDSKSAKSCVASTLAHDLAFVRVAHGHFAIRAFTKATTQEGGTGGSSRPGGGAAKMGQCTLGGEEPVVHLKIERQRFDRNSSKCSKCHKGLNQELPVLVLCDFCPRAYHVGCLRGQLPPYGDWACPKCIDKRESTVRKMKNMEESREERQLKKIAEREERERRRLEEREERERQRVREREERERAKEEARQKARYPIEDMEVLEEEKAKLASLEVAAAAAPDLASPGTPTTAHADAPRSLQQQQALVEGPRDQAPIMEGEAQLAGLMDGLAVVEFLSTFREECEVKALGLPELNHTVAWPLDGDSLAELYMALLRCVLLDQVGQTGMARSRARRWARVVDHATWPEVLRRYLLASREAQGVAKVDVRDTAVEFMDDHQIAQRAAEDLGSSPFYLLGPRYHLRLLHALCNDIINCSAMKDEVMGRLEETIQLCAEKYHADAEKRRLERQRKMQMKEGRKKREAAEQHQGEANNDAKKEQPQEAVKEVQGAQDVKEEVKEDVKEEVKEDVKEEVGQEATASEAQGDGAEGGRPQPPVAHPAAQG
ncbi:unnamed protein product [Ostreobium quekettii]|uniref:Uncharacterized protein n=1 Tax=Ostreobium quekettii TaxID=121088 RepID=A0A8S1J435_9CHLO|nr:unnamed protein product [Ostreobium quekettii]